MFRTLNKRAIAPIIGAMMLITQTACGSDAVTPQSPSTGSSTAASSAENPAAVTETNTGEPYVLPEGYYFSELTGEPISEEIKDQRPIAAMVDN